MRDEFLIFGSLYIDDAIISEVVECLRSAWWGTGPRTTKFEEAICNYTGAQYCVALNSCTAGLHLALLTNNIGPGDEVITTPITFAATANVIKLVGATPVFADIDIDTGNIDPFSVAQKITNKTRAIIPVHLAGRMCRMDELMGIASANNLIVIEDAAHALGAFYRGKHAGTIGSVGVFSFYATKNLATGDGGALITNNKIIADRVRILAHSGISKTAWDRFSKTGTPQYEVVEAGYKYGMMDIQAAIGLPQIAKFNEMQEKREILWTLYCELLEDSQFKIPARQESDTIHARHLFQIKVPADLNRDELQLTLRAENIGTGIHYKALHLEPLYKNNIILPVAEEFGNKTISLPLSPKLTNNDIEYVVSVLNRSYDLRT